MSARAVRFSEAVREELAHTDQAGECCRRAESAVLLRLGGPLMLRHHAGGQRLAALLQTSSGAVARRFHSSYSLLFGEKPEVEVHQPGGLRSTTRYLVRAENRDALSALGLVDASGRPREGLPAELLVRRCDQLAGVRAALMVAGSLSEPAREAHLEIRAPGESAARAVAALVAAVGDTRASVGAHGEGWRVVVKSGKGIGSLLARTGAHTAFLEWDQRRLRRELRGAANRAANADRANLARAASASARQAAAIDQVVQRLGWEAIPADLHEVALARLANPEATLTELGSLLDPPVGKATVHRRIGRLVELTGQERTAADEPPDQVSRGPRPSAR